MDNLKDTINSINNELNKEELEHNELCLIKEKRLRKKFKLYDEKELFKYLFLKDMDDIDIDDKIVIIFHIKQYDEKKFKKVNKKNVLMTANNDEKEIDDNKKTNNINDFKNAMFDIIKNIVLKGLEYAKELIKNQFDIFFTQATGLLKDFLKENGLKLLGIIIDKIRGGTPLKSVKINIDNKDVNLNDVLSDDDCQKINELSEKVNDIYNKTYIDIDYRISEAKTGKPIDEFIIENKEKSNNNKNNSCCLIL